MNDPHSTSWETWLQKWFMPLLATAIVVNAGGLFVDILEPVTRKTEEFAALLEVDVGKCAPYTSLLANATEELVRLTIEANVQEVKAREEKNQMEQESRRWRRIAQRLQRDVTRR